MPSHMPRDESVLALDADACAPHPSMLEDLREHMERGVARHREADALGAHDDGGVDTDHPAFRVNKRAAGIPGIECCVGLDHIVDEPAVACPERPADGAHDA